MHTASIIGRGRFAAWLLAAFLPAAVFAQDAPPPATPPAVERLSAGVYRLGGVTLDKQVREVRFAAVVNQVSGPIEYLLVGRGGKTHESVLRTEVDPMEVHAAMLLLGVETEMAAGKGAAAAAVRAAPQTIDSQYLASAPLPAGRPVTLLLRWRTAAGDRVERGAESVIDNARAHAPMSAGIWLYNGSFFSEGRFQAQDEKSFAALVTDPAALINNPRPGHEDDTIWSPSRDRLPPIDTPVEFVIQLPPPTS